MVPSSPRSAGQTRFAGLVSTAVQVVPAGTQSVRTEQFEVGLYPMPIETGRTTIRIPQRFGPIGSATTKPAELAHRARSTLSSRNVFARFGGTERSSGARLDPTSRCNRFGHGIEDPGTADGVL